MCPRCCGQDLHQTAHTEHNARNSASRRPGNRCSSAQQANMPATRRRVLHCTFFRCPTSHVCFSLPAITIPPTTKQGPWFFMFVFMLLFVTMLCFWMRVTGWCWIHAKFMLISCWFRFHFEFQNPLCNTLHQNWCWIHVEILLNLSKPWKITKSATKNAFQACNLLILVFKTF